MNLTITGKGLLLPLLLGVFLGMSVAIAYTTEAPPVEAQEIKSIISDKKGKVVVLNFWATWCPPCIKEFPDIIKLYDEYESRGLEVVAVSMNEPEEVEEVTKFLTEHKPPFEVYRAATPDMDFYSEFEEKWWGEMPMTMIYDKEGNVVQMHKKALTFEEFENDISDLLSAN